MLRNARIQLTNGESDLRDVIDAKVSKLETLPETVLSLLDDGVNRIYHLCLKAEAVKFLIVGSTEIVSQAIRCDLGVKWNLILR